MSDVGITLRSFKRNWSDPVFAALAARYKRSDSIYKWSTATPAYLLLALIIAIIGVLLYEARLTFHTYHFSFLWSDVWNPAEDNPRYGFGALGAIYGTIATSVIAMSIAMPGGLLIAWCIRELCPRWLRPWLSTAILVLAGIPSLVYGMFGMFKFAPFMAEYVDPWLIRAFGGTWLEPLFTGTPYGTDILTTSLILSLMMLPIIVSLSERGFAAFPKDLREAAVVMRVTRWELWWHFILPYNRIVIFGAGALGLGRALGETMAASFVIGNAHHIHLSLLSPGTTLASTLANEFSEAVAELYLSSMYAYGAILMVISFLTLSLGSGLLELSKRRSEGARWNIGRRSKPVDSSVEEVALTGSEALRLKEAAKQRRLERMRELAPLITKPLSREVNLTRRLKNLASQSLALLVLLAALTALGFVLYYLCANGIEGLSWAVFTKDTPAPGASGGLLNAIVGSLIINLGAYLIGIPWGILAGTYLAEYGRGLRMTPVIRFASDILASKPSILASMFVYLISVVPVGHFSAWAGMLALTTIIVPIVTRTTENALLGFPQDTRVAFFALGATRLQMLFYGAYRGVWTVIGTGVLLAVGRASGETAPLLFTSLNNQFFSVDPSQPMASLPVVIYQFAMGPYVEWHKLAWAGALLITIYVLCLVGVAKMVEPKDEYA